MAVGENAGGVDLGTNAGPSSRDFDAGGAPESDGFNDLDARQPVVRMVEPAGGLPVLRPHNDHAAASAAYHMRVQQFHPQHHAAGGGGGGGGILEKGLARSGAGVVVAQRADGVVVGRKGDTAAGSGEGFNQEMRDLEELLSKLNPMAEEFVPPSLANHGYAAATGGGVGGVDAGFDANGFGTHDAVANGGVNGGGRRRKNGYGQGKRRMNSRTSLAQRDEVIRRTVYVSYIDHQMAPKKKQMVQVATTRGDQESGLVLDVMKI